MGLEIGVKDHDHRCFCFRFCKNIFATSIVVKSGFISCTTYIICLVHIFSLSLMICINSFSLLKLMHDDRGNYNSRLILLPVSKSNSKSNFKIKKITKNFKIPLTINGE